MRIASLWRHPVKSLQGERVPRALVTSVGLPGDRVWAVRDVATGAVLSAKREPRLLLAAARTVGEAVLVDVPGGRSAAGRDADRLLSCWLGRPVTLDRDAEAPYVDEAHLHLIAEAEAGAWNLRRFRANVVVTGVERLDDLVGERLRLGSVVVEVTKRTKRCAMPTMAQPGLAKDVDVLRELARGRDLRLGVYAQVITPGVIDVGAPVSPA